MKLENIKPQVGQFTVSLQLIIAINPALAQTLRVTDNTHLLSVLPS